MDAYNFIKSYLYFSDKHISEIDLDSIYDYYLMDCDEDDEIFSESDLEDAIDTIFHEEEEKCHSCNGGGCNTCNMVSY